MNERAGVPIAILSSALGGTAPLLISAVTGRPGLVACFDLPQVLAAVCAGVWVATTEARAG